MYLKTSVSCQIDVSKKSSYTPLRRDYSVQTGGCESVTETAESKLRKMNTRVLCSVRSNRLNSHRTTWTDLENRMLCEKKKRKYEIYDKMLYELKMNAHKITMHIG